MAAGSFHDADAQPYTAEDVRFTLKGHDVFAIELGEPVGDTVVIHSVSSALLKSQRIRAVALLRTVAPLTFTTAPDGLHITLPKNLSKELAYTYRITVEPL